jgi:hypothetical protein
MAALERRHAVRCVSDLRKAVIRASRSVLLRRAADRQIGRSRWAEPQLADSSASAGRLVQIIMSWGVPGSLADALGRVGTVTEEVRDCVVELLGLHDPRWQVGGSLEGRIAS